MVGRRCRAAFTVNGASLRTPLFVSSARPARRACFAPSPDWLPRWCLTRRPEPTRPFRFASRSGAAPTSRPLHSIPGTSQSRDRRGGRLRGLAQAPALRLRCSGGKCGSHPARLGLRRGTMHQPRRLPPHERQRLTPAFQSAALHSISRLPTNRSAGLPLHCVPFRSLKPSETGGDALPPRRDRPRSAYRLEANRVGPRPR